MKVSLIIAVYKDIEALKLIIETLRYQTYKNFEVVIAEDGNHGELSNYIKSIHDLDILHVTQDDNGVRKSKSQNNGIQATSGEYLIFIDGDCLLHSSFIENHVKLSSKKNIVSGRRVNLGIMFSQKLRSCELQPNWIEKNFLKKYFSIANDARIEKHTEEGLYISPFGYSHKLIQWLKKKELSLLGCNFSCYKDAMISINGFDEGLGNAAVASDTDLEWRFKGFGYKIVSGRFMINQYHLYHKRKEEYVRGVVDQMLVNKENKLYRCYNGLERS